MTGPIDKTILRMIPAVDDVLADSQIADLRRRHPDFPWTHCVRTVIDDFRAGRLKITGEDRVHVRAAIVTSVVRRTDELKRGGMRRVVNGTGVILHTNLGRALGGPLVRDAVCDALQHYQNLEIDLSSGSRTRRGEVLANLVRMATEAESAMIVNNNAAAVYLVVSSYSPPGRIIVSRGELVEIGGSFRLPDILHKAASGVIEVGTTNRTYVDDYAREAKPGDILMRAHRSNYDMRGFTHEASISELVAVARDKECHVVYDLGSGSFFDFADLGVEGEECVRDVLATGVDCVTMSGDKLLGGLQAGIIVGRQKFLDGLERNPLRRAVRVDKITIAAMQALMRTYLFSEGPCDEIPVLSQVAASPEDLTRRATRILEGLPQSIRRTYDVAVVEDDAAIGGGSFAGQVVAGVALVFRCASEKAASSLAKRMRLHSLPVFTRIKGCDVKVNLRSVLPDEDADLRVALEGILAK